MGFFGVVGATVPSRPLHLGFRAVGGYNTWVQDSGSHREQAKADSRANRGADNVNESKRERTISSSTQPQLVEHREASRW